MKRPEIEKMKAYIDGLAIPIQDIPSSKEKLIQTIYLLIRWIEQLETQKKEETPEVMELLAFFNEKTGKKFPAVEANLRLIRTRVKEHGAKAVRQVIALKCRQWGNDVKWKGYLRPKTIFGATNFANYVGELG